MNILKDNKEKTTIINKSKFIGFVKIVYTKDDINKTINLLKDQYSDATHLCYAYILNNEKKYTDDGEPSGTAGLPILDVLEKNNLNYILAVVIRYFGGIKLGSNGLIRAYSNSISELLGDNIKEKEDGYLIKIIEDYNKSQELDYLLKKAHIIKKEYLDKLIIEVIVNKDLLDTLSHINYTIIKEVIM